MNNLIKLNTLNQTIQRAEDVRNESYNSTYLVIQRIDFSHEHALCGILSIVDYTLEKELQVVPIMFTLELPYVYNTQFRSCIPAGTYNIAPHKSPSHGMCFKLDDVPGRENILIHVGNSHHDTEGCILVGQSNTFQQGAPFIGRSKYALDNLLSLHNVRPFTIVQIRDVIPFATSENEYDVPI